MLDIQWLIGSRFLECLKCLGRDVLEDLDDLLLETSSTYISISNLEGDRPITFPYIQEFL
jgi:hypothetical protein